MKKGWEYKKLGAIADFCRGLTYKREDEVDSSDNCVLRSNNIDLESMSLNFEELKYIRPDFVIPEDKKLKANSVFVCMSNGSKQHVGKVAYINEDMNYAFGGFMGLIVPKPQVRGKYIYYVCRSPLFRHFLDQIGNGIGITNLRFSDLNEFSIPFPPLSEQQHIVEELDLLSSIIEKKKAQLNELDNLAQSLFYEMFGDPITNENGWEVDMLENVVANDCTISYGIVQPGDDVLDGIPVVRPVDLVTIVVEREGLKRVAKDISDSYKRTILKGGEILLCVRGTTGIMSFASSNLAGCNVTRGITPLAFGDKLNKYYAFCYLKSKHIQDIIADNTRGATLKQINMKDVRQLPMLIPPIDLQNQFASKIEAIEHQKELIKQSIKEVGTLFNSRMDYYFN